MRRQRHGYKSILSASRSLLTRPPWIHLVPLPNMYRGLHRLPLPYMYQYSQLCDSARAKIAVSEEDYCRTRSQLEEEVAEKYAGIKLSIYGTIVDKDIALLIACRLCPHHLLAPVVYGCATLRLHLRAAIRQCRWSIASTRLSP